MTNRDAVAKIAEQYEISQEIVQKAIENLSKGTSQFIAISGKIGAGKDTIAPLLLNSYGIDENKAVQGSFAYALKEEVQVIIEILRNNPKTAAQQISEQMKVDEQDAELIVEWLQEAIEDTTLTSYSRTVNIRKTLQYWATEIRRTQDENYWVKKAIKLSYENLADGKSVYMTDVRFPNEADAVLGAFGTVIRLNISPEVQQQRIMKRDGINVSENARNHSSETSLDDYVKFNAIVQVDDLSPEEIIKEITARIK